MCGDGLTVKENDRGADVTGCWLLLWLLMLVLMAVVVVVVQSTHVDRCSLILATHDVRRYRPDLHRPTMDQAALPRHAVDRDTLRLRLGRRLNRPSSTYTLLASRSLARPTALQSLAGDQ